MNETFFLNRDSVLKKCFIAIHKQDKWYILAPESFEKPSYFTDRQWGLSLQLLSAFSSVSLCMKNTKLCRMLQAELRNHLSEM